MRWDKMRCDVVRKVWKYGRERRGEKRREERGSSYCHPLLSNILQHYPYPFLPYFPLPSLLFSCQILRDLCHTTMSCVVNLPSVFGSNIIPTSEKVKVLALLGDRHEQLNDLISV